VSKVVHAYAAFAEALRPFLEKRFPDREVVCWRRPEDFAAGIGEVEYLFVLHPPRDHWARATRLRLIHCLGAGVDDVLPAVGLRPEVVVSNNRGMSAGPMSEFALTLVLALVKRLPFFLEAQREGAWRRHLPEPVAGRTLGILGLGAIGLALAERAAALGMRVIGTQRSPKSHPAVDRIFASEQTERVLAESDVVVLLLPLTEQTRGSFDAAHFARMRRGSHLVNLARGGIVDEAALLEALRSEQLASAAFDVFASEPLPADSPLWNAPNLWITPHTAGGFPDLLDVSTREFAENVMRMERDEPPRSPIDREQGY
jgi:phosphoglycerate dehydrogenase-like enzyme